MGVVGWVGMHSTLQSQSAMDTLYHDRVECLAQLKNINDGYSIKIAGAIRKYASKSINSEDALKSIDEGRALIDSEWKAYLATYLVPEEAKLAELVKEQMKSAHGHLDTARDLIKDKKTDKVADFSDHTLADTVDPVIKSLSDLSELQIRVAKEIFDEQEKSGKTSRTLLIAGIILAILVGSFLGYKITLLITRPLKVANDSIAAMARGNLQVNIEPTDSRDEIGEILRSTQAIAKTLQNVDVDLREQINAIREGALSSRVDASIHPGTFGEICLGINALLETVTQPMNEIAAVMAKLASGDIRGRVNGDYQGEIKALKNNVNRSLDALVSLLDAIGEFASALAKGDISYKVAGNFQGDFAQIKQNLNAAVDQLSSVLSNVVESTEQVSVSATETSAASKSVLEHARSQASHLNEVSTAIDQTGTAISEIAHSAERSSVLAQDAAQAAEQGQVTLSSLVESVHSIESKNKKISQISELIADIADKTYVLALNAGLEAVRAGDHGKGFGLIAAKITTLAEEVAEATRSIKTLIIEATDSVSEGVASANEAHQSVARIVELSHQNGSNVMAIATSVEEQNAMMQMLKERVNELKEIGATTAAASQQISVTMEGLMSIAHSLKTETDRLKTS
jgi:methyl-accepting chemotaxis protein